MKQNLLIYIAVDGVGNTQKGCIWERRRGAVSWIRFGGEGLRHLLGGIEMCCKNVLDGRWSSIWTENGRKYKLSCHTNAAGRFFR